MICIHLARAGRLWPQAVTLTKNARAAGHRVLLLVPQQYTLQTERELMDALRVPGFFDVDVLSPSRLTQRVFSQAGGDDRTRVDARGKAMAVSGALLKCKRKLKYYQSAAEKQGLVTRVSSLIADFKRALVPPETLKAYADSLENGAQKDKLSDLALIYQAYEDLLSDKFVDGEDVQARLIERVAQAPLVAGAELIVYGFDVLTGEMARLLMEMGRVCNNAHVLLTADPDDEAFSPATESARRFEALLSAQKIPYQEDFSSAPLNAPKDVQTLEQGLLHPGAPAYPNVPSAVRLYAAPTPYAEAHFVAREILLCQSAGIPFEEMQVLTLDEGRYFSTLDAVLSSYHIPHYLTRKVVAAQTGAAAFLLSALRAISENFRAEDVMAAVRTGYLPLSEDERFRMENYVRGYGINGKRFTQPFTRGKEEGAALEQARVRMMEPLTRLKAGLKDAQDTDSALLALMTLLTDVGALDKLTLDAEKLESEGFPAQAAQQRQVWKTLMALLDQMHELLSGARVTGAQAAQWLEAGLNETELSALPQDAGSVVCGLLGNVALRRPRVLFVMGLNDGALSVSENGLLTEAEQKSAEQALDAYLSLDADGREKLSRMDIYKALVSPSEKLYLLHAQALQDGTALRPLGLLRQVRALLPALVEEGGVTAPQGASLPLAVRPALDGLGAYLRKGDMPPMWLGAWHYLCQNESPALDALLAAFAPVNEAAPLPKELAHELFLERVSSVSRLETFAVCPFKHFIDYGLHPAQLTEWTMDKRDAGSFYHAALEGFTRLLPSVQQWPKITRKQCDELMDQAALSKIDENLSEMIEDSARVRDAYDKYKRLLRRVAWTFTLSAQNSKFQVYGAEVRFGFDDCALPPVELTLDDGSRVLLRGKIDRIDRYDGDKGIYLRVLDYKSGAEELSPEQVFYGTQLQLLLYLLAALQGDREAEPAGAFYFHMADPLLNDTQLKADVETKLAQALTLKGVTLRDAEVIRLLDEGEPPLSMPKLLKKDGDFVLNKQLATLEQMHALIEHTRACAAALAEGIAMGDVSAAPLSFVGDPSPCDRCNYAALCRKGTLGGAVRPRIEEKMTFDELLERINAE